MIHGERDRERERGREVDESLNDTRLACIIFSYSCWSCWVTGTLIFCPLLHMFEIIRNKKLSK